MLGGVINANCRFSHLPARDRRRRFGRESVRCARSRWLRCVCVGLSALAADARPIYFSGEISRAAAAAARMHARTQQAGSRQFGTTSYSETLEQAGRQAGASTHTHTHCWRAAAAAAHTQTWQQPTHVAGHLCCRCLCTCAAWDLADPHEHPLSAVLVEGQRARAPCSSSEISHTVWAPTCASVAARCLPPSCLPSTRPPGPHTPALRPLPRRRRKCRPVYNI